MKVLIVCSGNAQNFSFEINQAFIYDQINSIKLLDSSIDFDFFFIEGKGWRGYLKNLKLLKEKITKSDFNFIHAHSGDSILLASLQRVLPVLGTYHGSDLNRKKNRYLSNFANVLSKHSIVVSNNLHQKLFINNKVDVVPCGVDFEIFFPIEKNEARLQMKIPIDKKVILFSSSFNNHVKNFPLASESIKKLNHNNLIILELKGYKRSEINLLLNSADIALMTSFREGSPQFIKEAMACNLPIVSTDIGDVRDNIEKTKGCFITSFNSNDVAENIRKALAFDKPTNGRNDIKFLDNNLIAKQIIDIYRKINSKNNK